MYDDLTPVPYLAPCPSVVLQSPSVSCHVRNCDALRVSAILKEVSSRSAAVTVPLLESWQYGSRPSALSAVPVSTDWLQACRTFLAPPRFSMRRTPARWKDNHKRRRETDQIVISIRTPLLECSRSPLRRSSLHANCLLSKPENPRVQHAELKRAKERIVRDVLTQCSQKRQFEGFRINAYLSVSIKRCCGAKWAMYLMSQWIKETHEKINHTLWSLCTDLAALRFSRTNTCLTDRV